MTQRIERLEPQVVNRIAAGEVIHRPCNAVKELIENSIDAGANNIAITIQQGGLQLIQIQDNGKGIHPEDLKIVCERFTTSKIQRFEDLRKIRSFGFRGEALASISHVAHVCITSKAVGQPCAYKANYRDGKLVPKRAGDKDDPMPCAGKDGTLIVIDDLFYNLSTRRQALKNASEQLQRILDIVQKYSVHFASQKIGFVCKKYRESSCCVNTLHAAASGNRRDVVRTLYGNKIASELIDFKHTVTLSSQSSSTEAVCSISGLITPANFGQKKNHRIFFINNRSVECPTLRRACEVLYSTFLSKQTHPFLYLSLEMPPENVDVNVHPTKEHVHFLYEEEIVESIIDALQAKIKNSTESRTYMVQPIFELSGGNELLAMQSPAQEKFKTPTKKGVSVKTEKGTCANNESEDNSVERDCPQSSCVSIDLSAKQASSGKRYNPSKTPSKLIRTDHRANSIEKYRVLHDASTPSKRSRTDNSNDTDEVATIKVQRTLPRTTISPLGATLKKDEVSVMEEDEQTEENITARLEFATANSPDVNSQTTTSVLTQDVSVLASVWDLRLQIQAKSNKVLERLFREHTFVGVVNERYSLIQYRTKLYLIHHQQVTSSFFYQQILAQFGQLLSFKISPPLPIYDLLFEALRNPQNGFDEEDGPMDVIAADMKAMLVMRCQMLAEYYSIDIDTDGMLHHLPMIIPHHRPSFHFLPELLFDLATNVNWEEELRFADIASIVAKWYGELRYPEVASDVIESKDTLESVNYPSGAKKTKETLEHIIFPALKSKSAAFMPSFDLNAADVIKPIACLSKLYKVFERC